MAYCIDANIFIQPKNLYYPLDFCPAYWSWLDREAAQGTIICIRPIYDEVAEGKDELAAWIRDRSDNTWLCKVDDTATQQALRRVVGHVEDQRGRYTDNAIDDFMAKADPWLIAYCLAHGHTVVTHERRDSKIRRKVPIPNICDDLGVPSVDLFDLLRTLKVRFLLDGSA